jgi:hypothetical protein
MTIRDQTLKAFPFLFEQFGFAFLDAAAGDSEMVVIAQSGLMRLRFIQDRADFFLDVGSSKAPEKWIGLYDVLDEMKRKGLIFEDYKYVNKIGALSGVLRKTFPALREYLLSAS